LLLAREPDIELRTGSVFAVRRRSDDRSKNLDCFLDRVAQRQTHDFLFLAGEKHLADPKLALDRILKMWTGRKSFHHVPIRIGGASVVMDLLVKLRCPISRPGSKSVAIMLTNDRAIGLDRFVEVPLLFRFLADVKKLERGAAHLLFTRSTKRSL